MIPRRQVNVRLDKKTIILCINPDSDSDVVIEEEEGNFREACIITRRNERDVEEEAEQADDERSGPLTVEETEPGTSLAADQETEDKTKQFPALLLRISIEKRWRENSSTWPPITNRSEKVSRNWWKRCHI